MKKVLEFIRKYEIAIITALIILIIGGIILLFFLPKNKDTTLKKIDESSYYLSYDSTWKIDKKEKDKVILKHNSGSKIIIQLTTLTDEYR